MSVVPVRKLDLPPFFLVRLCLKVAARLSRVYMVFELGACNELGSVVQYLHTRNFKRIFDDNFYYVDLILIKLTVSTPHAHSSGGRARE